MVLRPATMMVEVLVTVAKHWMLTVPVAWVGNVLEKLEMNAKLCLVANRLSKGQTFFLVHVVPAAYAQRQIAVVSHHGILTHAKVELAKNTTLQMNSVSA